MSTQLRLGLLLGIAFGLWNLISTQVDPYAEDTIPALLAFYGPMFAVWGSRAFELLAEAAGPPTPSSSAPCSR